MLSLMFDFHHIYDILDTFILSATILQPSAISWSVTVTTPSTRSHRIGKVSWPTWWVKNIWLLKLHNIWPVESWFPQQWCWGTEEYWTRVFVLMLNTLIDSFLLAPLHTPDEVSITSKSGGDNFTLHWGLIVLTAVAIPAVIPPPDIGTKTRSRSGTCSINSRPIVPWHWS